MPTSSDEEEYRLYLGEIERLRQGRTDLTSQALATVSAAGVVFGLGFTPTNATTLDAWLVIAFTFFIVVGIMCTFILGTFTSTSTLAAINDDDDSPFLDFTYANQKLEAVHEVFSIAVWRRRLALQLAIYALVGQVSFLGAHLVHSNVERAIVVFLFLVLSLVVLRSVRRTVKRTRVTKMFPGLVKLPPRLRHVPVLGSGLLDLATWAFGSLENDDNHDNTVELQR